MENKKSETLLEVKNLKKYFKTPGGMLHAVDDVSFSDPAGQDARRGRRVRLWKINAWTHLIMFK